MNARPSSKILTAPALYEQVAERLRSRIFAHELAPKGAGSTSRRWPWNTASAARRCAKRSRCWPRKAWWCSSRAAAVTSPNCRSRTSTRSSRSWPCSKAGSPSWPRAVPPAPTFPASPRSTTNSSEHAAANNADRFFEANQRFHTALQEIAGNRYLAQLIDDARKVIKLTRRDSLRLEGRLKQSLAEHREILEALRAKDAALARQAHARPPAVRARGAGTAGDFRLRHPRSGRSARQPAGNGTARVARHVTGAAKQDHTPFLRNHSSIRFQPSSAASLR
jgi:hypothetical protein